MDDNNSNSSSSNNSSHLYPHLHHPPPSSHYRAAAATHMPFPSYYLSPADGGGGSSGLDPAALVERPLDLDFDSQDCESEDGIGALEEPPKPGPARGSGSKRSRAAEVHNLSEKRRRSRINEKMKALQNLIPNSNKTDKASMLDEAIEYLKQLQLQVQMLSMRNGINLHPVYMPGALQGMQSSQLCLGFGVDSGPAVNMGVGLLPLNLESSAANSYSLLNRDAPSHQPSILPSFTAPGASFRVDRSHSHHGSFQLPVAAEHQHLRTEDVERQGQLDSGNNLRAASLHFGGQASSLGDAQHMGRGVLTGERSEDVLSKDPDNQMFIQHFHGLHTGSSFPPSDVKPESP